MDNSQKTVNNQLKRDKYVREKLEPDTYSTFITFAGHSAKLSYICKGSLFFILLLNL